VVLFGSILLSHSKTINAKVVSFLNLYTLNAINKNSTILTRGEEPKNQARDQLGTPGRRRIF